MLHIVFMAFILSASAPVSASQDSAFSAEVARIDKLVKSSGANLDAVGAIKLDGKIARGYICIRATVMDKGVSKRSCVHMYKLTLGRSSAPVTTGVSKVVYERKTVDGQDCAKLVVTESSVPVDRSFCLIDGVIWPDMIILDDDDPEMQVTAKIVCFGSNCEHKK